MNEEERDVWLLAYMLVTYNNHHPDMCKEHADTAVRHYREACYDDQTKH